MTFALDFHQQVVWVTGGASGIGAAIVEAFEQAGATVISLDRAYYDSTPPDRDRRIHRAIDLRDTTIVNATVQHLIDDHQAPHVLVNNAGIVRDGVVWKMSDADWGEVLDVNLAGAFRMARACCPAMRARRSGAIVNITSINGLRGKVGQANYAASKAGLIALTKTLARELAPHGVRANAVAPGMIATPMTDRFPEVRAKGERETLLGRIGRPDDVAAAALFLASPLAGHITGQVLVVDGGQLV